MAATTTVEVDPFDLPEWLAGGEVTWRASSSIRDTVRITGELSAGPERLACDLLAADVAYPTALLDPDWRRAVHEQWSFGQVLLLEYDGRLTLAAPGTGFTADAVLDTLSRLAKAVGVRPATFVAALRL